MSAAAGQRICFGSSQERKVFPLQNSLQRMPHIGPGCYDNHQHGTIINEIENRPCSKKGPGAYDHNAVMNRKVSWPMCFGRPDLSRLPQLEKKSVRVKQPSEKEFLKQRNRVAYLSLYY
ncbi:ciliary microtubule-associated protein 3 [Pholidichthys leucotaenia]